MNKLDICSKVWEAYRGKREAHNQATWLKNNPSMHKVISIVEEIKLNG